MAEEVSNSFKTVNSTSNLFPAVKEEILKRTNIYGDQDEALKKLENADDRLCEVLLKNDKPLVVIIYKKNPQEQVDKYDIKNSLEVKTFLPLDKENVSHTLNKALRHLISVAETSKAENIHMTVSEREKPTFRFLMDNHFKVCDTWYDKYINGVKEYLVSRNVKKEGTHLRDDYKVPRQDYKRTHDEGGSSHRHRHDDYGKRKHYDDRRDERDSKHHSRVHHCTLKKKYVHLIQEGLKTVEGRIATVMFQKWKQGDIVRFHYFQPPDEVHVKLEKVTKYDSFRDMLEAEGVIKCIPDVNSVEKAVNIYNNIPGYRDKERRYGVYGFQMKVVPKPK